MINVMFFSVSDLDLRLMAFDDVKFAEHDLARFGNGNEGIPMTGEHMSRDFLRHRRVAAATGFFRRP